MNKKLALIFCMIFLVGVVSAEASYCCEKTVSGAWCQNSPEANCDAGFRKAPTSCEATSYCKLGCCYDSQEGTCMENTPQKICEDDEGVWEDYASCEIPQCSLGCCLIGDQAAFVTQTRCKRLASLYGLEINFRTDISTELQCIVSITSSVKGACVFEQEFEKTCKFISKKECLEMNVGNSTADFYEGLLCSTETLGTNCAPTQKTTCVEGRDEVYYVDSCGNLGNIYDAVKLNDKNYWKEVYGKSESCGYGSANSNSANCGSCDYYLGSTCKEYQRSEDKSRPKYGDNICRDLACVYDGETYSHGETWCADANNLPGSRHFRFVCYNGEVTIEPCADFRQEICMESDIDGFKTSACVVNKWQTCFGLSRKDCLNTDKYDCKLIGDTCVPKYAPGFNFWDDGESEADSICSAFTTTCEVVYEEGLVGDKKCIQNCECCPAGSAEGCTGAWQSSMAAKCKALGDCGSKTNFMGY